MASIAIRAAFEVFGSEHSSSELEVELEVELEAELEVDSKTLNNMVKFLRHLLLKMTIELSSKQELVLQREN